MKRIPLKEICSVFGDGDWIESKDQSDSGIRLIQTGNVGSGVFKDRIEKARWISEETFKKLRCTEIGEGDVLISRLPDPVGRACLLPALEHKAITAVDCSIVRFDTSKMDPRFFVYFSQSLEYYAEIQPLISGATRQRISREKLGTVSVPLPSLEKQREIVEKLDKAFAEIDLLEGNLGLSDEKANQLLQSLLSSAFASSVVSVEPSNPSAYQGIAMKLVKLTDVFRVGSSKRVLKADWKESGVPFYRGREITRLSKTGSADNELFISESHFRDLSTKYGVPIAGDIMVTAIGTIGSTYIVTERDRFYFKDASVLWLHKKVEVDSRFIDYWLKSDFFFGQLDKDNGATVDTLTIEKLSSVELLLPSLEKQCEIVEKLDRAFVEIDLLRLQIKIEQDCTASLRQSLLSSSFTQEGAVA